MMGANTSYFSEETEAEALEAARDVYPDADLEVRGYTPPKNGTPGFYTIDVCRTGSPQSTQ